MKMKNSTPFLWGFLVGWGITGIVFIWADDPILSDTPIMPDLRIEVTDGITDTTYIYRAN